MDNSDNLDTPKDLVLLKRAAWVAGVNRRTFARWASRGFVRAYVVGAPGSPAKYSEAEARAVGQRRAR